MFCIDIIRCTGCGSCVDACPKQAITMHNDLAMINEDLCIQCGACANVCPAGAIREVVPAQAILSKGGEKMVYGFGRGSGRRGGAGFGFRGTSPSWPYVGRGRGGLPRCWHPGLWGAASYPQSVPYWAAPAREEESGFLKDQADVMKSQLEDIERRIKELEKKD
ncbi:4Fe-4S binding protein [Chloroflexota bacterium]